MANQEHIDVLKQGVEAWNKWREEHPDIQPDLRGADLYEIDLSWTPLHESSYAGANLTSVDFSNAGLGWADLTQANLTGANLSKADIGAAQLFGVRLTNANLSEAWLTDTNLSYAILKGALFYQTNVLRTLFTNVDLSEVRELETLQHHGPSSIGLDTIYRSQGKIPERFLREAGVPDTFLDYLHSLVGNSINYYTCFISYSSKDEDFAKRLYADLQSNKVHCWFAPEDLDIGDKIRPRIEESIRLYDKLLLVLSENSIASNWVAYEVERALNKEPGGIPNVLFPVRLDRAVMESTAGWATDIKGTRHIGDFSKWKNHDDYQKAFARLLRALKAKTKAPRRL